MSGGPPQGTMTRALWRILKDMQGSGALPKGAVLGTASACQYVTPLGWNLPDREPFSYWCDVQPEKDGESLLKHVPMPQRVMNYPDDLGVIFVPKQGTEVLVEWIDGRPTITDCQEWEQFIVKKSDSDYIWWDSLNNVDVKTTGAITVETLRTAEEIAAFSWKINAPQIILGPIGAFSAVLGEILNTWLGTHTHVVIPTTVPGVKVTGPPIQAATLPLHLSRRVKLDM